MGKTFFLFETAAGYALYQVEQWEQIGHVDAMEEVCCTAERFKETVKFKAFQPFGTAAEALENIRAVVEGEVTPMLGAFLGLNLPKKGAQLAVVDPALGKSLTTKGFKAVYDSNVLELVRGCRLHEMKNIAKLASGASAFEMNKFQVGLGHNFSRSKLQIDPRRHDKPVINCVALLDSLTKNLNSFAMRVREWYGWHFPELVKIVPDNKVYCQVVQLVQRKDQFAWSKRMDELAALLGGDEALAASVKKAANQSIGHELSEPCMQNILNFATQVVKLEEMREHLNSHLASKLAVTAPNLSTVAGNVLSGRLISHAGSLVNLAKMSASSIQILGAEKALFRALKTRSNTPKYGLIFQANIIGKASLKHKGRAARYLANKCALAARLDCFCDVNTDVYGKRMVELLGKRMAYLAGGPAHETSIEVMKAASNEYKALKAQIAKDKRESRDEDDDDEEWQPSKSPRPAKAAKAAGDEKAAAPSPKAAAASGSAGSLNDVKSEEKAKKPKPKKEKAAKDDGKAKGAGEVASTSAEGAAAEAKPKKGKKEKAAKVDGGAPATTAAEGAAAEAKPKKGKKDKAVKEDGKDKAEAGAGGSGESGETGVPVVDGKAVKPKNEKAKKEKAENEKPVKDEGAAAKRPNKSTQESGADAESKPAKKAKVAKKDAKAPDAAEGSPKPAGAAPAADGGDVKKPKKSKKDAAASGAVDGAAKDSEADKPAKKPKKSKKEAVAVDGKASGEASPKASPKVAGKAASKGKAASAA